MIGSGSKISQRSALIESAVRRNVYRQIAFSFRRAPSERHLRAAHFHAAPTELEFVYWNPFYKYVTPNGAFAL
jgi:hypothetical protein